jgi:hypothetical protein
MKSGAEITLTKRCDRDLEWEAFPLLQGCKGMVVNEFVEVEKLEYIE